MSSSVDHIAANLREAGQAVARDVHARQGRWRYHVRRRRVWFDREVRHAHQQLKQSIPAFIRHGSGLNLLTTPIVYSLCLPLLLLDVWVTVYQRTCFPIYGIHRVPRRAYFVIDRHKLTYLNAIEKANCTYCSYANGLIGYVREIAARTEQVLVSHQALTQHPDASHTLSAVPRLRRRGRLSPWSCRGPQDTAPPHRQCLAPGDSHKA